MLVKPLHFKHLWPSSAWRVGSDPGGADHAYTSAVVQLHVRLPTSESRTPDMLRALSRVMVSARVDRGCVHAELARDTEEASVLIYFEDWADVAHLERRIRSDPFCSLLEVMEACPVMPQLEVRFVSDVQGLEYVASVRHAQ